MKSNILSIIVPCYNGEKTISDCADAIGRGNGCQGSRTIAAVRRISSSKKIERKLLYENSKKLFKL